MKALFRRAQPEGAQLDPEHEKMVARAQSLSMGDLQAWTDTLLYSLGRELTEYWRNGEGLDEAETSAQALLVLVREIRSRARG